MTPVNHGMILKTVNLDTKKAAINKDHTYKEIPKFLVASCFSLKNISMLCWESENQEDIK